MKKNMLESFVHNVICTNKECEDYLISKRVFILDLDLDDDKAEYKCPKCGQVLEIDERMMR